VFKGKNLEELDVLMREIEQARKIAVIKEKVEADNAIRETLQDVEKGNPITVVFKGEEVEGIFDKLTEKRATVLIRGVRRSIQLDTIVSVA